MVCLQWISSAFEFFFLSVSLMGNLWLVFPFKSMKKTTINFLCTGYGNGGKFERRGNPLYYTHKP